MGGASLEGVVPPLGKVILSCLIKLIEQAPWIKSPSSILPWCLSQFLPCLLSVTDCLIEVEDETLSSPNCLWSWCFITATETLIKTARLH